MSTLLSDPPAELLPDDFGLLDLILIVHPDPAAAPSAALDAETFSHLILASPYSETAFASVGAIILASRHGFATPEQFQMLFPNIPFDDTWPPLGLINLVLCTDPGKPLVTEEALHDSRAVWSAPLVQFSRNIILTFVAKTITAEDFVNTWDQPTTGSEPTLN